MEKVFLVLKLLIDRGFRNTGPPGNFSNTRFLKSLVCKDFKRGCEDNISFRNMVIAEELEPGQKAYGTSDMFLGLGLFGVTVSVSCDEDIAIQDYANGIVFGFLYFIP